MKGGYVDCVGTPWGAETVAGRPRQLYKNIFNFKINKNNFFSKFKSNKGIVSNHKRALSSQNSFKFKPVKESLNDRFYSLI